MDDINALGLIRTEKEKYTIFTDKLKSGEDLLLYNKDVQSTTERSVRLCTNIQKYINAIQDEIQSLNDIIKSFTIHLGEKMKQLVESGYFEETNTKIFKSEENGKNVVTSVLQFIGIKPSTMSGDTKAKQDARKRYDVEQARLMLEYEKIANQQHNLQKLLNQTEDVLAKAKTDITVTNSDVNSIASALRTWSDSLENAKERKKRKAKEEAEKRKREEDRKKREKEREETERRRKEEEERKRKEAEEQKRREEEERKRKEEEERKRKEEEERKRIEEEERKRIEEEERKRKEEERKRQEEEEERKRKEEGDRKRKEEEERRKEEEEKKRKEEEERQKREAELKRKEKEREEAEQKRKEEEERKRKEEDRKRKEEVERKLKEEEERKRKEEMRRKDPNNWPVYKYYRGSDQGYHNGLCCVVTVVEGNHGFTKEDLSCLSSDRPDDLKRCSENREEIVVASVVKIIPRDGFQFVMDVPMRIFVPYMSIDNDKEIKLKISIDGSKWTYPEKITPTANLNEINVPLVGASLVKFNMVEIAVVSRPKRENFTIKNNVRNAAEIRPSNNENLIMRIPEGTFKRDICAHLKVDNALDSRVSSEPDFNHIRIATPLFGVEFDEYTQNDVTLHIQPNYIKKTEFSESLHGRAIHQCANKLVTDMAVDDVIDKLQSKSVLTEQIINKIQSRASNEAKARELLELFKTASESGFKALVESLSAAKQGHLAQILQKTLTDLEESELGSDFEDVKSSKLQLVSSNDSKEWKLMNFRSSSNLPNNTTVSIPSNQRNFDLIGFVVPKGISDEEICRVANEIYQRIYQVPVRLIVKQHMERPSDLYIRCVEKSKSGDAQKEMANQGYKDGPEEMVELGLCDTEEVIFNANGNIKYVSGATQMSFFLNIDTAQLCVQIDVVNKKAQFSSRTYQGNLAYNVGDTPQSPPRSGSFLIHLPKEAQRYAPLTLDVPVKAAAKYLAWQLTKRGSPDKHDLYMKLCMDARKVKVLKNRANREGNTERKCCEAFIMSWASQRPKQENKVTTILESLMELDEDSLAKETDSFLMPFMNGFLSEKSIKQLSAKLEPKWELLARKLGFDDENIKAFNMDFDNDRMRALHMLDRWRLEDSTVELATDINATLLEAMDSLK